MKWQVWWESSGRSESFCWPWFGHYPAKIYWLKVKNRNTRTICEICSKLTIITPERRQWRLSGVYIVNSEQISRIVLCFCCWIWASKWRLGRHNRVNFDLLKRTLIWHIISIMKLVSRATNALGVILQKLLSELLYQLNENAIHVKVEDLNLILKDTFIKNICTSFLSANEFSLKIFRSVIVNTFLI